MLNALCYFFYLKALIIMVVCAGFAPLWVMMLARFLLINSV